MRLLPPLSSTNETDVQATAKQALVDAQALLSMSSSMQSGSSVATQSVVSSSVGYSAWFVLPLLLNALSSEGGHSVLALEHFRADT